MAQRAVVLCDDAEAPDPNLIRILEFFGVAWQRAPLAALFDVAELSKTEGYCVFSTMPLIGKVLGGAEAALPPLLQRAESIFLFRGDESEATSRLLVYLTGSPYASIVKCERTEIRCFISHQRTDICGPLTGLHFCVSVANPESTLSNVSGPHLEPLIWSREGCFFGVVSARGKQFYLTPAAPVDIEAPIKKPYFDIADYVFSAAPLVMYLSKSFHEIMPKPPENGACLIVDDPMLRLHYGSVDFQKLALASMEHHFTCTVAFIPWNWNRSRPSAIELFKKHPSRLSLCIHGCDHTGAEFGTVNAGVINTQAKLAMARMQKHGSRTGLPYDPVMVFPQGAFSSASLAVLKHNGFIAAVNTEVSPIDQPKSATIRDVWQMAISKYADFPIYTRRYSFHGLPNFAFDLLLGKPCLLVTHHSDFQNEGRAVVEFIDRLNSLSVPRLSWRSLGDVIRHAYHRRLRQDGVEEITMWGGEIIVENPDAVPRRIAVAKVEHQPEWLGGVEVADRPVAFRQDRATLRFEFEIGPNQTARVRVSSKDTYGAARLKRAVRVRLRTAARRYFSECRDEAQAVVHKLQNALNGQ